MQAKFGNSKQEFCNKSSSQSTAYTLDKLNEEEIALIRQDYDIKQVIEHLKLDNFEDVDTSINHIKEWFKIDEIRYTNQIIKMLETKQQNLQRSGDKSGLGDYIKKQITETYQVRYQKDDYESIIKGNQTLKDMDVDSSNWNKFIDGEDLKIWYRKREGCGMFDFYYEKEANAPIENVVCVVREAQTFKTWVPMLYESRWLHEITDSQLLGEVKIRMPWPIKNRACYVSTNALINSDSVDVNLRTVHSEVYLQDKEIPRDKSCEEIDAQCLLLKVQRLEQNKQRVRVLMTVDPKCENMPDWLLNNICKVLAAAFMSQVAKRSENLYDYDDYKVIMKEKSAYYENIGNKVERRRLQEMLEENPEMEANLFRSTNINTRQSVNQFGFDSAQDVSGSCNDVSKNIENLVFGEDYMGENFSDVDEEEIDGLPDIGEKEGSVSKKALLGQNIQASMERPKVELVSYKKGAFKYQIPKDDPNFKDLQALIQVDGEEMNQEAINKQLNQMEKKNENKNKSQIENIINTIVQNNHQRRTSLLESKQMKKRQEFYQEISVGETVPLQQQPLTDRQLSKLQIQPVIQQIETVLEPIKKKKTLHKRSESMGLNKQPLIQPRKFGKQNDQIDLKNHKHKRQNSITSIFSCCRSNSKQPVTTRPKWQQIE